MQPTDAVIVGRGPAALLLATKLLDHQQSVTLIADGQGSLPLWGGQWDFRGYDRTLHAIVDPYAWWAQHSSDHWGSETSPALWKSWWGDLMALFHDLGIPMPDGLSETNRWLLTPLGHLRPTYLAPSWHFVQDEPDAMTLVGFDHLVDFAAPAMARVYSEVSGKRATPAALGAPPVWEPWWYAQHWAAYLDSEAGMEWLIQELKGQAADLGEGPWVFPQVLGIDHTETLFKRVRDAFDREVKEVPLPPPAIGGLRMQRRWERWLRRKGLAMISGKAVSATKSQVELLDGRTVVGAQVILATGGVLGGGIAINAHGEAKEPLSGEILGHPQTPQELGTLGCLGYSGLIRIGRQVGGCDSDQHGDGGAMMLWSVHKALNAMGLDALAGGMRYVE